MSDNKESKAFRDALKSLYFKAKKDDESQLVGVNIYPKLPHSTNKYLIGKGSTSYRVIRLAQTGILRKTRYSPRHTLDVKRDGYAFARQCGVRCPEGRFDLSLNQLTFEKMMVTKPMYSDGGKCIYAWQRREDGTYYDYFTQTVVASADQIREKIASDFNTKGIKKDGWIQEEVVVGLDGTPKSTHDVKFYAFYGEILAALQVDRWDTKTFVFFDVEGKPVDTGTYSKNEAVSPVFTDELVDIARDLSKKIPWPHVRLDFLISDNDCVFGEFTSNPGSFADFNDEWDALLANAYHEAYDRLYRDLLRKKDFSEYIQCFGPF